MKLTDIVQKTDKELDTLVAEQRQALASLAIEYRTKKVANIKQMNATKKTIARTLTILRQRAISTADQAQETKHD